MLCPPGAALADAPLRRPAPPSRIPGRPERVAVQGRVRAGRIDPSSKKRESHRRPRPLRRRVRTATAKPPLGNPARVDARSGRGHPQRVHRRVRHVADATRVRATGLRAPSRFSFKLKDVEHALDMIVGFGRTITPGALGRRLVIRDAEQRLIEMTDRHAGRRRTGRPRGRGGARLPTRPERGGGRGGRGYRAAIERAITDRRRGEEHARGRLDQLAGIERRCTELSTDLDRWSADPSPSRRDGP